MQAGAKTARAFVTIPQRPAPFLPAAIGLIGGITLSEYMEGAESLGTSAALTLAAALWIGAFFLRREQSRASCGLLAVGATAFAIGLARHHAVTQTPPNDISRALTTDEVLARVRGVVVDRPASQPSRRLNPFLRYDPPARTRFRLAVRELVHHSRSQPVQGDVRVVVLAEGLDLRPGDVVEVTGELRLPRGPRNPGETDWARWHRLHGFSAAMSVESAAHVRPLARAPSVWQSGLGRWRAFTRGLLIQPAAVSDGPLRLLDAIVLGQRSAVDQTLNDAFFRTGSIHILSVSGFHVGVLAGFTWWLLRRVLRRGVRTTACVTALIIVLYSTLAEPDAPIIRSAIMGVLGCVALLLKRPLSILNWLSLSACGILLFNPLDLFTPGFQLSFVQVLALFTVVPLLFRAMTARDAENGGEAVTFHGWIWRSAWRMVVGASLVSVVAWLVSIPLVMHHFGQFTPWSALQSLVLSPLFAAVILFGFLTLIASATYPPAGLLLGEWLHSLTARLIDVVELLAAWPGTLINVNSPPAWLVIVSYLAAAPAYVALRLYVAARESDLDDPTRPMRRTLWLTALSPLILACLWAGWTLWPAPRSAGTELQVFAVGNGSCAALLTPAGEAAVIDAGTSANFDAGQAIARALRALRVKRVEWLALSHADLDHFGGAPRLLETYPAGRVITTPQFLTDESKGAQEFRAVLPAHMKLLPVHAGAQLELHEVRGEVLWPPEELPADWEANDTSLVLRLQIGPHTVLAPGDIERHALRELLEAHEDGEIDLAADVLIAPHHGSIAGRETARFYAAVAPRIVIISSAMPRPKLETLIEDTLGDECEVYTTGPDGAIMVDFGGPEIRVRVPFSVQ